MPLSLLNHSALALFAQRTRIPTSARSIGFCAIWVCISSSSSSAGSSWCQLTIPSVASALCDMGKFFRVASDVFMFSDLALNSRVVDARRK